MPENPYNDRTGRRYGSAYRPSGAEHERPGYQDAEGPARDDTPLFDPGDSATGGVFTDMPILGWLTGDDARARRAEEQAREQRDRNMWADLASGAPGTEDLAQRYYREGSSDEYGDLMGGPSELEGLDGGAERGAQLRALREMQGLVDSGGYTSADYAMRNASQLSRGAALRQANQAAQAQAQARGAGGGGQELLARLGASQAANTANAQTDAAMQQVAMQRALQAMQYSGQQANTMYDQEAARRNALDAFNRGNLDWRRGRETRNTAWGNKQEDARTQAMKDAYGMRERAVAGATNQYNPRVAGAQNAQDQANKDAAAGIGTLIDEIL